MSQEMTVNGAPQVAPQEAPQGNMGTSTTSKISLQGTDTYREMVTLFRSNMVELVNEGHMTPATAERLTAEFEYTAFQQSVKIILGE